MTDPYVKATNMRPEDAKVGLRVFVKGWAKAGARTIRTVMTSVPGGVVLDEPVDGLRSWNVDELWSPLVKEKP